MSVAIDVTAIKSYCNPYGSLMPWGVVVTEQDVATALAEWRLVSNPDSEDHAGRIAYLVINPTSEAIAIDVGCPAFGSSSTEWMVSDGNHRLAAAIYRESSLINADVSGQLDHACELFNIDCTD
jgi:hypothetical protein